MPSSRLNLPVFRQIQDIKRCLTLADILYTSVSIRWVFVMHVLRQKSGHFFEKRVKFPAFSPAYQNNWANAASSPVLLGYRAFFGKARTTDVTLLNIANAI